MYEHPDHGKKFLVVEEGGSLEIHGKNNLKPFLWKKSQIKEEKEDPLSHFVDRVGRQIKLRNYFTI